MERKDAIQNAYRLAGNNSFYDGMITCSTIGGKAMWVHCLLRTEVLTPWFLSTAFMLSLTRKQLAGKPTVC